ncbi:MAG: FAD-binding oxidoreductase [Aquificae bacterium]|nr:FAD-binding oxidoreductase [Aquificota bacterium]
MNWTYFPRLPVYAETPPNEQAVAAALKETPLLPYGRGRCYNDACLSPRLLKSERLGYLLSFDEKTGLLEAQAGVTLGEIVELFLPRGFFPPVVPGTAGVTLGGAVSADVHGKNDEPVTFCSFVEELTVLLPSGERLTVKKGDELFKAFCGGLGLLGFILRVKTRLRRVKGAFLKVKRLKPKDLDELLTLLKEPAAEYSVAWLDLLNDPTGNRSIVLTGSFTELNRPCRLKPLPFLKPPLPRELLVRLYDALYYARGEGETLECYARFFFPLDRWRGWNRFYLPEGFTQTQFLLPEEKAPEALSEVLKLLSSSGLRPYLAVLKYHRGGGEGLLSFIRRGFSLALDFPLTEGLPELMRRLERLVLGYGGRHYLVKDAFLSRRAFYGAYGEQADEFKKLRKELGAAGRFESYLSTRLGL